MHKLETLNSLPSSTECKVPDADCMIFDGHFVIQMLPFLAPSMGNTYCDMASNYFEYILKSASSVSSGHINQIHVAFDRYLQDSVKNQTRQDRANNEIGSRGHEYNVTLEREICVSKEAFLQTGTNKASLAKMYTKYIEESYVKVPVDKTLYLSGGYDDVSLKV